MAAKLEEQHVVSLSDHCFSPDAAVALVRDKDLGIGFRSLNLIDNATFGERSTIVAENQTPSRQSTSPGLWRPNRVRDITSTNSGDQSQEITRYDIVAQAREVAAAIEPPHSNELREAADDVEKATEPKALRRAVTSIIGIASLIGEHGSALLDLGRRFLDGLTS